MPIGQDQAPPQTIRHARPRKGHRNSFMKSVVIASRVIAVLALLFLVVPFAWEKITGDYFMTVTGVSMEPTYAVGDVLSVQRPDGSELREVGRIVVVSFTPGDLDAQYVHRVHRVEADGIATLKGDNNDTADPTPVGSDQVMGSPRFALQGWFATLFHFIQSWGGRGILIAVALAAAAMNMPHRRVDHETPAS